MVAGVRRLVLGGVLLCGAAGAATPYRVQTGDTLLGIALRAGVSVSAIRAVNPALRASSTVQLGRVIQIPDRSAPATTHTVTAGQNLTVIARKYGLTLTQLVRANPKYASGRPVPAGARLSIPARQVPVYLTTGRGTVAAAPARPAARSTRVVTTPAATARSASPRSSGDWLWPVTGYTTVSSGFGGRTLEGEGEQHYGIDIVAPVGTPVRAARAGRVLESRPDYQRGWGWTVVIEHPDGWITRYAHLSANLTRQGEWVVRGQPIGRVGDTGRSTGPHLHFGTYLRWDPRDPMSLYR